MNLTPCQEIIKEKHFNAGNAILRPIATSLGHTYPMAKRVSTYPSYDAEVELQYNTKFKMARDFLYEQRNLVQRKWLPRYLITRGTRQDTPTNTELKQLLIDGSLDRLYETLVAYCPILVQEGSAKDVSAAMRGVYEYEARELDKTLSGFNAILVPGTLLLEQEMAD